MSIEDSVSLIAIIILYSPAVFTLNFCCNFIVSCFYPPFWRPKGCKSSASEYNASLLVDCKRAQPTLFKRHSTDKISRIALLLTNFRKRKCCLRRTSDALVASVSKLPLTRWHELSSVGRYLSATFPTERLRGSV